MPYTITTTTYPPGSPMPSGQHRATVATLDEARWAAADAIGRAAWALEAPGKPWSGAFTPAERAEADDAIPAEGGTIGPLPDRTVIEVRPTGDEIPF